MSARAPRHARQAERDRIAEEDLRERLADDRAESPAADRLRRVLARRAAAEVGVDHQDRRPVVARVGHRDGSPPARLPAESSSNRCSSSPSNDTDLRNRAGMMRSVSMLSPRSGSAVPRRGRDRLNRHAANSLTSTTSPATAAAATIAGLISSVRPVGLPCRPLKLRFDDEAQISRPSSRSWFIARHIEQPAPRHSNPASMNTRSRPSRSAAARTACEPGTTSACTCGATWRPADDARRFAEIRQPRVGARADEGDVDPRALDRLAGGEAHELERLGDGRALAGGDVPGRGSRSST